MSKVISPTIGRRLWYYPSDYDRGARLDLPNQPESFIQASDTTQPCDAGVVYVHSDRLVNLIVTDHNGYTHRRTSVTLVQPGDEKPGGGAYATWMPYQTQQAASLLAAKPSVN
jgi:hypothetical protein